MCKYNNSSELQNKIQILVSLSRTRNIFPSFTKCDYKPCESVCILFVLLIRICLQIANVINQHDCHGKFFLFTAANINGIYIKQVNFSLFIGKIDFTSLPLSVVRCTLFSTGDSVVPQNQSQGEVSEVFVLRAITKNSNIKTFTFNIIVSEIKINAKIHYELNTEF